MLRAGTRGDATAGLPGGGFGGALLTALHERWTGRFGVDMLVKSRAEHAHIRDINVGGTG